jgi:hypothetical protein
MLRREVGQLPGGVRRYFAGDWLPIAGVPAKRDKHRKHFIVKGDFPRLVVL